MDRATFLAVAVACLLVSGGCMGLFDEQDTPSPSSAVPQSPSSPEPSLTPPPDSPALSPSSSGTLAASSPPPTPVQVAFPPGMTGEGISSRERLVSTHVRTLTNTSFTARLSAVRTLRNGTVTDQFTVVVRYDGDETVHIHRNVTVGDPPSSFRHVETWSNATKAYRRIRTPDETRFEQIDPLQRPPTFQRRILTYVRLFETTVTGWSHLADPSVIHVAATDLRRHRELEFLLGFEFILSRSFRLAVTERGLREYRLMAFGGQQNRPLISIGRNTTGSSISGGIKQPAIIAGGGVVAGGSAASTNGTADRDEHRRIRYVEHPAFAEERNRRLRYVERLTVSKLGTTTVDRPVWLNRAVNRTRQPEA